MQVTFDADDLKPLIEQIVRDTIQQLSDQQSQIGERLAFGEHEAAKLLGLEVHVLRDVRLRGEIAFSRIANRRISYSRSDLLQYLVSHREDARV